MKKTEEHKINDIPKGNTDAERQRRKRKIISDILSRFGWGSQYQFLTAIGNGVVKPPINPDITVSHDSDSSKQSAKSGDIGG